MVLFFLSFVIIPMAMGIFTFFGYTMGGFHFNGLDNYIELFKTPPSVLLQYFIVWWSPSQPSIFSL